MNPDYVEWSDPMKVVGLLADIMDAISGVRYDLRCMNKQKGEKAPKPPKPYPRPIRDDSKNEHVAFDKEEFKAFYFDN